MSSGSVAIVVIVCLMAAAGGAVFLVMYFKRESRLRKLLGSIGQETRPDQNLSSFDNVGYESSSSKQMPPSSSSDAWIKYIVRAYVKKKGLYWENLCRYENTKTHLKLLNWRSEFIFFRSSSTYDYRGPGARNENFLGNQTTFS